LVAFVAHPSRQRLPETFWNLIFGKILPANVRRTIRGASQSSSLVYHSQVSKSWSSKPKGNELLVSTVLTSTCKKNLGMSHALGSVEKLRWNKKSSSCFVSMTLKTSLFNPVGDKQINAVVAHRARLTGRCY